ncbi:hypothetical protein J6TS1_09510 [Siminovitchia terrae]|uniref:Uncharacterized protein n=1 Tax=Siminovitchia terrae TaxID=1914933 RepID=A0ABQ4KU06_SIMTE|nr:hypothetical protein J22TS1_00630 [Siminovitchia terrae]GIN95081.1 hypothetical protein J6TS1_09510 [Siminovitchia terrae]
MSDLEQIKLMKPPFPKLRCFSFKPILPREDYFEEKHRKQNSELIITDCISRISTN